MNVISSKFLKYLIKQTQLKIDSVQKGWIWLLFKLCSNYDTLRRHRQDKRALQSIIPLQSVIAASRARICSATRYTQ